MRTNRSYSWDIFWVNKHKPAKFVDFDDYVTSADAWQVISGNGCYDTVFFYKIGSKGYEIVVMWQFVKVIGQSRVVDELSSWIW